MKLRMRLAVIVCAVSLPLVAALFLVDARSRHETAARMLAHVANNHLRSPAERTRCEEQPHTWGGTPLLPAGDRPTHSQGKPQPHRHSPPGGFVQTPHGAPPVLFAYDQQLVAKNPGAPQLGADWADAIADADVGSLPMIWPGGQVEVLVRMPWTEGPCALILARGTTTAGWVGAILPADPIWLLPLAAVVVVLLLAAGPLVRRIMRLAKLVRTSAESGFVAPVVLEGNDELAELSRAFDAAARTVREQLAENRRREQALREFLANTTHDVMTPLTALADHLTSLDECAQRGIIADATILTAAINEVQYLGSILDNLAIAAKLDAGEPELERTPVDLNGLLERVVIRHRTIARRGGISLELGLPEEVLWTHADLTLLEQAIGNLVDNGIRHNQPGGHAAVLLERLGGQSFRIRVLDDGPGIASGEIDNLLQRGARGARTRETLATGENQRPGQGLGLAIALRVAERHGFTLELVGGSEDSRHFATQPEPSPEGNREPHAPPHGLQVDVCGPLHASDQKTPTRMPAL